MDPDGLDAVAYTHVDDFLIAFRRASKAHRDALKHLVHKRHWKHQTGTFGYCGRTISSHGNHIKLTQAKSTLGLEFLSIDLEGRTLEQRTSRARRSLRIPKRVGTVVVVGKAVAT